MKTIRQIASAYEHLAAEGAFEAGFPQPLAAFYRLKYSFWGAVSAVLRGRLIESWCEAYVSRCQERRLSDTPA